MADLSGAQPELIAAIKEIHDGVYMQGKRDGVHEFMNYLFDKSILFDAHDVSAIKYYAAQWEEAQHNGFTNNH